MSKLIFVNTKPFLRKDYERLGIDFFLKKKVEVQFWYFHELIFQNIKFKNEEFKNVKIINHTKKTDILDNLKNVGNETKFIMFIYPSDENSFIFEAIKNSNFQLIIVNLSNYPSSKFTLQEKIKLSFLNPKVAYKQIKGKIKKKLNINKEFIPDIIFSSGSISKRKYIDNLSKNSKIINCNSYDYDKFLRQTKNKSISVKKNISQNNFIVYLDNFLPFHTDQKIAGYSEENCNPKIFYKEINNYFSYIEKFYSAKIIILAYPTAQYDISKNPFEDREIIYGNTIEFVKYSMLVLTHNSTSVNFAALHKKPINFISSDNYSTDLKASIRAMAKEFNKSPIYISRKFTEKKEIINADIYEKYLSNYIVSKNKSDLQKYSYQIIYDNLFSKNERQQSN